MPAGPSPRFATIDLLKAVAIVAVTLTHAVPNVFDPAAPRIDRLVTTVTCFHVPAFLFSAGLLASRSGPVAWRAVVPRLLRIIVPYAIASMIALALGMWHAPTLRRFVFRIVTGSGIGIYYFVPVLAACYLTLPLVSRLSTRIVLVLTAALAWYAQTAWHDPSWRLTEQFFWQIRDVLLQFHLGHFVLGVLAARLLPILLRVRAKAPVTVAAAGGATIVGFVALAAIGSALAWEPLIHTLYMLGMIAVLASAPRRVRTSAVTRFLSDMTLPIYLYHVMIYPLVILPVRAAVGAPLQIVMTSASGIALGAIIANAARRTLGRRSRLFIGA